MKIKHNDVGALSFFFFSPNITSDVNVNTPKLQEREPEPSGLVTPMQRPHIQCRIITDVPDTVRFLCLRFHLIQICLSVVFNNPFKLSVLFFLSIN